MDRRTEKARRIAKAREILKDSPVQDIQDVGDFLDVAADMADETDTYQGFDGLLDLDAVDDDRHERLRERHSAAVDAVSDLGDYIEELREG